MVCISTCLLGDCRGARMSVVEVALYTIKISIGLVDMLRCNGDLATKDLGLYLHLGSLSESGMALALPLAVPLPLESGLSLKPERDRSILIYQWQLSTNVRLSLTTFSHLRTSTVCSNG